MATSVGRLSRLGREAIDDGLLLVPEAVSGSRFPLPVRIAHHLLCALAAMLYLLYEDNSQSVTLVGGFASVWCGILAHRLLRRSVSETAFFRDWGIGWAAMAISTVLAFSWNQNHRAALVAGAVYVAAFPLLMIWIRPRLSFWFPAPERGEGKKEETLMPGRNWQTLLWLFVYTLLWIGLRGDF